MTTSTTTLQILSGVTPMSYGPVKVQFVNNVESLEDSHSNLRLQRERRENKAGQI